ncbi:glycosyl transferase [Helicobacter sp. CaF467b]|uniref:glycosyltransferase n=1 Tax=Helicobacter sp. CaF467b TaxID=2919923 RepID=UPI001F584901|nr:glycosyltransferase [Helicobacter sp. CaF467b]MCI2236263.1 glycosyl transferase [Helicobacter sp. CaF467b]
MKKHKFGILLAATKDSSFTLGVMIANIKDKMGSFVDVFYIVHDGFSPKDKEAMERLAQDSKVVFCEFTQQTFLDNFKKFNQNNLKIDFSYSRGFLGRWTHMVYACFEIFRYLEECENILYLDFDILLLKGLEHLLKLKESGITIAAERGKKQLKEVYPNYNGEFRDFRIYRSPIIFVNDSLINSAECYAFVYQKSIEVGLNDQGVLSLLIFEKSIKAKDLGKDYVGSVLWIANDDSYFIHSYGRENRFWNNQLCHQIWREWGEYYEVWLNQGGLPYLKGFVAKTTYGYERVRFSLAYKVGYAIVECYYQTSKIKYLKLPLKIAQVILKHKRKLREYRRICKISPHLRLPMFCQYEDYQNALKEKQSIPYKLGEAVLEFCKEWWKCNIIKLYRKIYLIKKQAAKKS